MKRIQCENYNIIINNWKEFESFIPVLDPTSIFVLVDENSEKYCLHLLLVHLSFDVHVIKITSGETNKSIETCQYVWSKLIQLGADRNSLLINLGGGVIGDLGGFCAATYMRGINFIQVPTTLLSQVDSSIGGKLGVDLNGYKNMVGVIKEPNLVFIFTDFLKSLPENQLKSGYAEALKHGLIADRDAWASLANQKDIKDLDYELLVYESVLIKKNVTEQDPMEKGLRKVLNFGHTVGHAIESYWMDSKMSLLHGEAIAIGMISEAFLSYKLGKISEEELFNIRFNLINLYGHHPKLVKPMDEIIHIMKSDKKNRNGSIRFSLLDSIGNACYDQKVEFDNIEESLIFYKEKI